MLFTDREVRIGKNCARGLEYGPRPAASCRTRDLGHSFSISILLLKEENTMIILRNPQIAELIEAGCAFKSNVIISKNETKK